ncbi:hypothetical protein B9Z55_023711 [Caenorhabditis nigoni]|uniref:T-box domain-containing protein n=2 Tax=Caenorhabditis nigoni TaxID=1611254 RepID=A0A2G5SR34_9PELO|nr:hypothetical protein B9Z55_023711 [Caenorhabditis nigoni]
MTDSIQYTSCTRILVLILIPTDENYDFGGGVYYHLLLIVSSESISRFVKPFPHILSIIHHHLSLMESSDLSKVIPSQNTLAPQALSMPIGVTLKNIAEFELYSSSVLEQPINVKGRYFYPSPGFNFTGMDPNAKYQLSLRFDKVSNGTFHFIKDAKQWIEIPNENATNVNISPENNIYLHPNTFSGRRLMSKEVVFEVPMSNSSSCLRKEAVVLESSYKYQAVLLVSKIVEQGTTVQLDTPQEFTFDCITFIVVHKYRNPEMSKIKAYPRGYKRNYRRAIEMSSSTTLFSIESLLSPDEKKKGSVTLAPATTSVNLQFPIGPTFFADNATILLSNGTNKALPENAGSDHSTGSPEDTSHQYDFAGAASLLTQHHGPSGTSSANISLPLGPRAFTAVPPFLPTSCMFPLAPPGNFYPGVILTPAFYSPQYIPNLANQENIENQSVAPEGDLQL